MFCTRVRLFVHETWSKTTQFFLLFQSTGKGNPMKATTATAYVYSDIFQMLPRQFNRETVQGSYVRLNSKT